MRSEACAQSAGDTFRVTTGEPPVDNFACSGLGWTTPPTPPYTDSTVTNAQVGTTFIDGVRLVRESGGWADQVTCAGCSTFEFKLEPRVSANETRKYHVLLVANDLGFLKPTTGTMAEVQPPTSTTTERVSGILLEQWGRCNTSDFDMNGNEFCTGQTKYRRYRGLRSATINVATSGLKLNLRSRPSTAANLSGLSWHPDNTLTNTAPAQWTSTEDCPTP
jgi:hypothetical protein